MGGVAVAGAAGGGGFATTGQQPVENGGGPGGVPGAPAMPKRRWIPWVIVGILLLAVLIPLADYGAHRLGYLGGNGYFYVPPVDGQPLSQAVATLTDEGLKPVSVAQQNSAAKDTVLSTNPDEDNGYVLLLDRLRIAPTLLTIFRRTYTLTWRPSSYR